MFPQSDEENLMEETKETKSVEAQVQTDNDAAGNIAAPKSK